MRTECAVCDAPSGDGAHLCIQHTDELLDTINSLPELRLGARKLSWTRSVRLARLARRHVLEPLHVRRVRIIEPLDHLRVGCRSRGTPLR